MSISKYRKFIFSMGQELSTENLSSLKYLLRDLLTTNQTEGINSPTDLFVLLEQRNELGSDNCHLLKDLLRQIKRQDLVKKLEDFKRNQLAEHNRAENDETVPRDGSVRAVNTEDVQDCVDEGEQASAVSESDNENGSHSVQLARHNRAGKDETAPRNGSVRAAVNKKEIQGCVADGEQAASAVCESNGSRGESTSLLNFSEHGNFDYGNRDGACAAKSTRLPPMWPGSNSSKPPWRFLHIYTLTP